MLPTPTCCCQRRAHINNNRIANDGQDRIEILLILTNADTADHEFTLPRPHLELRILASTHNPDSHNQLLKDGHCKVAAHSMMVLAANTTQAALAAMRDAAAVES